MNIRIVTVLVTMWLFVGTVYPCAAQHSHSSAPEESCLASSPHSNPGDYLYGHDCYHDIYKTLNKGTMDWWNSCCKGHECRVTEDIQDAPPELKTQGIDYLVVVDGRMCPATSKHEVQMSPAQRELAKKHPLYQSFLQHSHVCAAEPVRDSILPRPKGTLPKYSPEAASSCPVIHCIIVPPRT
jgi:hypothetical protein